MPRNYLNDELIDYFLSSTAYSYLRDFHLSLVYEMLPSISTTLMITSAMTYSVHLSSPKTLTTLQGLIGASYYGLGPGLGTFLGDHIVHWLGSYSLLNNTYGIRASFRVLGVTAAGTAMVYLIFNLLYIRTVNKRREVKKEENHPVQLLLLRSDNVTAENAQQSDEDSSVL